MKSFHSNLSQYAVEENENIFLLFKVSHDITLSLSCGKAEQLLA